MSRIAWILASFALLGVARPAPTVFDLPDQVGKALPAITLPTPGGGTFALQSLRGTPAYVFLYASYCEPCTAALPLIRADYARYRGRVRFVAIDVYEDAETASRVLAELPFESAFFSAKAIDALVSPDEQLRRGTFRIPADIVVDAHGIVRASWRGAQELPDGTLRDPLPAALAAIGIAP